MVPQESWQPDAASMTCNICKKSFSLFNRRHHCRVCGLLVCGSCSARKLQLAPPSSGDSVTSARRASTAEEFLSPMGSSNSPLIMPTFEGGDGTRRSSQIGAALGSTHVVAVDRVNAAPGSGVRLFWCRACDKCHSSVMDDAHATTTTTPTTTTTEESPEFPQISIPPGPPSTAAPLSPVRMYVPRLTGEALMRQAGRRRCICVILLDERTEEIWSCTSAYRKAVVGSESSRSSSVTSYASSKRPNSSLRPLSGAGEVDWITQENNGNNSMHLMRYLFRSSDNRDGPDDVPCMSGLRTPPSNFIHSVAGTCRSTGFSQSGRSSRGLGPEVPSLLETQLTFTLLPSVTAADTLHSRAESVVSPVSILGVMEKASRRPRSGFASGLDNATSLSETLWNRISRTGRTPSGYVLVVLRASPDVRRDGPEAEPQRWAEQAGHRTGGQKIAGLGAFHDGGASGGPPLFNGAHFHRWLHNMKKKIGFAPTVAVLDAALHDDVDLMGESVGAPPLGELSEAMSDLNRVALQCGMLYTKKCRSASRQNFSEELSTDVLLQIHLVVEKIMQRDEELYQSEIFRMS